MKKLNFDINYVMLNDLISTAIEGGSNYWYLFSESAENAIRFQMRKNELINENGTMKSFGSGKGFFSESILPAVLNGAKLDVFDIESPDDEKIGTLSIESINKGIAKMKEDKRPEYSLLYDISEDTDYDADDADVIFQYITLGELVYG